LQRAYSAPESQLTEREAASTLFRFFRSKHVIDLRLIVFTIVVLLASYLTLVFIGFIGTSIIYETFPAQLAVTLTGPAVGIAGLIIGWAYKAASIRLGIIDLFGCEVGTLCRVGTVLDVGTRYVNAYERGAEAKGDEAEPDPFDKYTSQENYFPIFEHNSKDLQFLEALVVCPITEFYTFMKAARDTQRRLATIPPPKDMHLLQGAAAVQTPWHATMLDVVYMIFLGYEAGRRAINYLIEFEPAAAENTIVILITELTCYGLLLSNLKDDRLRYPRLKLRQENYRRITAKLYRDINSHRDEDYWRPAQELMRQLTERYESALGEPIDQFLATSRVNEDVRGFLHETYDPPPLGCGCATPEVLDPDQSFDEAEVACNTKLTRLMGN
jgi:hypothetical protein